MIITVEQIEVLRPYIENIEELISADDVDALLDAVDDAVVDNIVAHNDEPDMDAYDIPCSCSHETVHPHARTILPCIGNMQPDLFLDSYD